MERVYVANLPPDIRIKDIDDFFRPFGNLVYIDVNHRANPVVACVQFDDARNAFNAVKSRHGYDYEGYTLQLRLVENEVRKRRDATPPPPPPSMCASYERQNYDGGFNNNYNSTNNRMGGNFPNSLFQTNFNSQWAYNNRSGMQQQEQNMTQYATTNRLNMTQYATTNCQNMTDFPTNNRSNIPQLMPYSSSDRSNMFQQQQQNFNLNRLNMQQQYSNRSDMSQQNRNYSNTNRFDMLQQNGNRMDYSNNSFWSSSNNSIGWNSGNYGNGGNNYNKPETNEIYNPNNDPYARPGYEDSYTRGLSGSGRKWFNRYIRKGFSPKIARAKALEHRTVPYLREGPRNDKIPNDPTNVALESIGNTIMSFLSTNPVENYKNENWKGNKSHSGFSNIINGGNFELLGPSSSNNSGRMESQTLRNAVSRNQYLKSLGILKKLRAKREQSAKDGISKKYHTQIVKDYEQFEKTLSKSRVTVASKNIRNDKPNISTYSEAKLSLQLRKKKRELLIAAKRMGSESKKHFGGAYKKRKRILMNEAGFSELEAKALAVHPIEKLKSLISIKKDYDMAIKNDFTARNKKTGKQNAMVAYQNDIRYLNLYEKQNISSLSHRIKNALRVCLTSIHKYEKERKLPLTQSKFVTLLPNKSGPGTTATQKKQDDKKQKSSNLKKTVVDNRPKTGATTNAKKEVEKRDSDNTTAVDENNQDETLEQNIDNHDNEDITDQQHDNENITEEQQGEECVDITGEQYDEEEHEVNNDQIDGTEDQNEE